MLCYVFPGQGSQAKGMGEGLFEEFPELTKAADRILNYSVKEMCMENPDNKLADTQYTQPMLYLVNTLTYLHKVKENGEPNFLAGHSLGEYNALFAAKVFDFETGLKLVQKRGELMSKAKYGGMAAVIGLSEDAIREVLEKYNFDNLCIANFNSSSQLVISGSIDQLDKAEPIFSVMDYTRFIRLKTSGAFHSKFMKDSANEFEKFIQNFEFYTPKIPVLSNYTALPYPSDEQKIKENLVNQITGSVRWVDSIRYMMGHGANEFVEIGTGLVLTGLIKDIKRKCTPITPDMVKDKIEKETENIKCTCECGKIKDVGKKMRTLGSEEFKKDYGVKYAYIQGSMYKGISSEEMVIRMANKSMLGMFGTGGLSISRVEEAIIMIKQELRDSLSFGMNILFHSSNAKEEEKLVDLYLKYDVKVLECSAYVYMTPALVRYRLLGARKDEKGHVFSTNHIIAKISRPEVAEIFMKPAPDEIVERFLMEDVITTEQAKMAKCLPMADDICAEADSAGHTDQGVAFALIPTIIRLRDKMQKQYQYDKKIRVGAAGGIGTDEAALASFVMGADFITTGSVNQCTVESNTSASAKDILQSINIQDTQYAPAGDMFELGSKVQVVNKGVFFPARANKLYELYKQYESINDIDEKIQKHIQEKYFKKSFQEIYAEVKEHCSDDVINYAESNEKFKMALIFKTYFKYATKYAIEGDITNKVNYQIQCGPALGAFNQWVQGTGMEDWHNRHVDDIAEMIMVGAQKKMEGLVASYYI